MKGLVIKDLIQIKHMLQKRDAVFVVGLIAVTFFCVPEYAGLLISAFFLFTVSGYSNTVAICEAQTQWNEYEAVLPLTLGQRVKAKYYFAIGLLCCMFCITIVLNFFVHFIFKSDYYFEILLIEFWFAYMQMLFAIPCNIKKDENSGGYVFGIFLVVILLIYAVSKYFGSSLFQVLLFLGNQIVLIVAFPISIILGTIISYKISLKNYR